MTERQHQDEAALIDFLRDELPDAQREEIRQRLENDTEFRCLHDNIANGLKALGLATEIEPPADLVEATMARVRQARRTETLLAREESRRPAIWPTFSLRELSGVAAAVILIAAIFVPAVRQARQRALIGQCAAQAGQIGTAMLTYAYDHDDFLPAPDAMGQRWLSADGSADFSNSSALFKLIHLDYAKPAIFRCPARGGETFVFQAGMSDFPAGQFIGYSYQHTSADKPMRTSGGALAAVADRMVIMSDCTPMFTGGSFRQEKLRSTVSENHDRTGQNVLHLDMHVSWATNASAGVDNDNIFLIDGVYNYKGDETPTRATDTFLLPAFSHRR